MTDHITSSPPVLEDARRLLEVITPGDWHAPGMGEVHSDHEYGIYVRVDADGENDPVIADGCNEKNAEFIAASPRLVRDLVAVVATLTAERDKWVSNFKRAEQAEADLTVLRTEHATLQLAYDSTCDVLEQFRQRMETADASLTALRGALDEMRDEIRTGYKAETEVYGSEAEALKQGAWIMVEIESLKAIADRLDRLVHGATLDQTKIYHCRHCAYIGIAPCPSHGLYAPMEHVCGLQGFGHKDDRCEACIWLDTNNWRHSVGKR